MVGEVQIAMDRILADEVDWRPFRVGSRCQDLKILVSEGVEESGANEYLVE